MSRLHSDTKQTASQGTITHMPPELIRKGQLHRSADVWAFGVLLWEMYSGQRAWMGMSYTQIMQAVGYEQRSPDWPADAPAELAVSPVLPYNDLFFAGISSVAALLYAAEASACTALGSL